MLVWDEQLCEWRQMTLEQIIEELPLGGTISKRSIDLSEESEEYLILNRGGERNG